MNRFNSSNARHMQLENQLEQLNVFFEQQGTHPFGKGDSTVGMEYELQVAVEGSRHSVDLPVTIDNSRYYKSIRKRTERGDLPDSLRDSLESYLSQNNSGVWENSWVSFARDRLSSFAKDVLAVDLLADKSRPELGQRGDVATFCFSEAGEKKVRVPISYLMKLAMANAISGPSALSEDLKTLGKALMENLVSDNTSPEILSFSIPVATQEKVGKLAAEESARTLLFCQLLVQYANLCFGLADSGQRCVIYSAPHAPSRQKLLNEIVPEGFYRHLFISPCLSGWDRGEDKYHYMRVCHKTLSRSQLNTIGKLKDAGIILNNLIVLPNTSTTCLANNGTHVSIGSMALTRLAQTRNNIFSPPLEKHFGDLVTKIVEHFLPLFVNTYSASPYRLDFADFHPEKVLGFLPHELDYTHLRMLWRRWKRKANLQFFGKDLTPFGPNWLDTNIGRLLHLKGDLVPDFRLIDFLVSLLSTESSPGLDGLHGNQELLKHELSDDGVFDAGMSMYLLFRQRVAGVAGYCGFEGRIYSLFESLLEDMSEAVNLQNLVTALACQYVLRGEVSHHDIPDDPSIESERRQIFFATAAGIPTVYIRKQTRNRFLRRIVERVAKKRNSKRYRNYIRVEVKQYKLALLWCIDADGLELVEQLQLRDEIHKLRQRMEDTHQSAYGKLTRAVGMNFSSRKLPLQIPAKEYNLATEDYYRTGLKKKHVAEGLNVLTRDVETYLSSSKFSHDHQPVPGVDFSEMVEFVQSMAPKVIHEAASEEQLLRLIHVALHIIRDKREVHTQ